MFRSKTQHPRFVPDALLLEHLAKFLLGSLRLTGKIKQGERSRRYVEAYCSLCSSQRWILVDNIKAAKTTGCPCDRKYAGDKRANTLGARYDAMIQRCRRDSHVSSKHYKGRGIEVRFDSREHFVTWALSAFPRSDFKGLDFDRTDNDGHYEPSNLRLVTRSVNLRNGRRWRRSASTT